MATPSTLSLSAQRPLARRLAPLAACTVVLLVLPSLLPAYLQDVMTKVLILAIFALSFDLLLGYTGLFSFGHAAFLGVGSYTAGMLMLRYGVTDFWIGALVGTAVAVLVGAAFGIVALRVRGSYFLLVTFALAQLLVSLATTWAYLSPGGNGSEGIFGISLPALDPFTSTLTTEDFYYLAGVVLILCFLALRRFLRTPMGLALQGVREAEVRMRALGFNTWTANYVSYVVASGFAGLAGVLLAYHDGIAVPATFGVYQSTLVILMVLIGGVGTLYGPLLGAALIVLADYYASTYATERSPLIIGTLFVLTVMFARRGIAGALKDTRRLVARRRRDHPRAEPGAVPPDAAPPPPVPARASTRGKRPAGSDPALTVAGLSKNFGGVHALEDVSLAVDKGERLAVIGTNGAGKSTLFDLISGELKPTRGQVSLFGADITRLPVHRRAQLGIGRSFQTNTLFPGLPVLMNVWLAMQAVQRWRWQVLRPAARHRETLDRAEALLVTWGLADVHDELAKDISYGEQRRLEIVLALASEPRLLLMDEPTAGQTLTESLALAEHLRALPRDVTAIVIAHDMDLVFSFADRIVVLHQGAIVAEGTSAEIQANPVVQETYMGTPMTSEVGA